MFLTDIDSMPLPTALGGTDNIEHFLLVVAYQIMHWDIPCVFAGTMNLQ